MSCPSVQLLISNIQTALLPYKSGVKRRAQGFLRYDYLVPSGYYEEQWDWDAFFIGMALAGDIPSEAIFLKNWVLNALLVTEKDGYTPGVVRPDGPETGHRAFLMKPFIAQGAYFSSQFLNDYSWIKPVYPTLISSVTYRERNLWDKKYDLGMWTNSMESGADNNVAILDLPDRSVIATDVNTFIYREYKVMSKVANALGKKLDSAHFSKRARDIKKSMQTYLWSDTDSSYFNIERMTGNYIKRVSYNTYIPLWGEIATQRQAEAYIKKYMLNPNKLWSNHGIRTLSKDDAQYSNINMIKPHSNWQGPVWPIANYLAMHGLLNYGLKKEAVEVAKRISNIIISDIKKTGGMHENYNAETGEGIAAPNFISWNLLVYNMLEEAIENKNPSRL